MEGATKISTYIDERSGAKAGASIKPVIVLEFVDLDAFAIRYGRRRQRHCWTEIDGDSP